MCGICGMVRHDALYPVQKQELMLMAAAITPRGPDDEGYYINGNAGLGFRRLSIIDLAGGHQPLANEDESIWIVFNGEIYNQEQLRKELINKGHQFKTRSDTETIVHLYEEYGRDCVRYLRGMFGFAIWDERKKTLFCARDRFGIKPFFYYLDNQVFLFGSEIKSLLAYPYINANISLEGLDQYLAFGYSLGHNTIFKHIKKLEPAHTLELKAGHPPRISKYWNINYQPDYHKTEEEWCELIEQKFSESVKIHLMSDVPLGAFLSGGIDSSAVVALMAEHSDHPFKTFSIGFKEEEFNELPYAREVARLYGTEHHEQIIEPESISLLSLLVNAYDEPFADASAIPTYYVSRFARAYVKVVLSGDGGDELFAGYKRYPKMQAIHNKNIMPDGFNRHFWGGIHHLLPSGLPGKGLTYYLSRPRNTVAAYQSVWQQTERARLYRADVANQLYHSVAEHKLEELMFNPATDDFLFNMQQMDMRSYLVDDVLTKVDRVSMLNSLEVRVPILDHEFAELTFKIPSQLKLNGQEKKYIFKKAMSKHLPASVLTHKKQGFAVPLKLWFKSDLKDYVHDRLLNTNGPLYDYLNQDMVAQVINNHQNGMRDFNTKIWSLLFLDEWLVQNTVVV